MIAVITGDIIGSRKMEDSGKWLTPLKELLNEWGPSPLKWEIYRGDSIQVEVEDLFQSLKQALRIKALIKGVPPEQAKKKIGELDIRLAIGIGEKSYEGAHLSESNGSAFIFSGEMLDKLKKEKMSLAVKTPWNTFNADMNLYLKLACMAMDDWTLSAAEVMQILLAHPELTQAEIGKCLGIEQNSVNYRLQRAHAEEVLEVEEKFKSKLREYVCDTH